MLHARGSYLLVGSHDDTSDGRVRLPQQHTHCGPDDPNPHLMG
jgi:hypothetical protein